ncbi:MAG: type II secretion system protein [Candidatus Pacebacteria bacterium]|nr:type II secretion system protein [Candidatus Paceibacterota bacterium]
MEPLYSRRGFVLSLSKGFSLIELLVAFGIITVLMSVVLSSQSTFNKSLVLSNTAYDIALTLRSAETFGLSARGSSVSTSAGYGLHFSSGSPGSFTLFSDTLPLPGSSSSCHEVPIGGADAPDAKPGNCVYDGQSEKVTDYALGNGIIINDFCAKSISWSCVQAHGSYSGGLSSLDIIFARPNPSPFMSTNGSYSAVSPVTEACISVVSPQGGSPRYISIEASGQIITTAASCP